MKTLIMVATAICVAVGTAPCAAADEASYLDQLQPRFATLTGHQLVSEGYKVCRYVGVGRPAGDAIPMVTKDLEVGVSPALDIIAAALVQLDC
jgi:hypothetical protein